MNRWLPLPEGLYPGLGKGTRFAQILYGPLGGGQWWDAPWQGWLLGCGRVRSTTRNAALCAPGLRLVQLLDRSVYRSPWLFWPKHFSARIDGTDATNTKA